MPRTGFVVPSSESSPIKSLSVRSDGKSCCERTRIANAIGKSRCVPSFSSSAGARLIVTFFWGEAEIRICDGRTDTFSRFGNGFVCHSDNIKTGEPSISVTFNSDDFACEILGNRSIYFCNHGIRIRKRLIFGNPKAPILLKNALSPCFCNVYNILCNGKLTVYVFLTTLPVLMGLLFWRPVFM